ECGERAVRGVGLHAAELRAALLVEAPHRAAVARPRLGRRDVLGPVALPQPAMVAERAHAGIRRHAGAGQHDHVRAPRRVHLSFLPGLSPFSSAPLPSLPSLLSLPSFWSPPPLAPGCAATVTHALSICSGSVGLPVSSSPPHASSASTT